MPRIVGGIAKGRRLAVPVHGTRPTSDRAREAMFSTLAGLVELDDAAVLDLFAGTGAVGLEALSRGAVRATFVESNRGAATVLQRNIDAVGLPGAQLRRVTAEAFLAGQPCGPYGLAFADPPYALDDASLGALLARLARPGWLAPGAVVVVERGARGRGPFWPDVIGPMGEKRYGDGALWYGRRQ